MIDVLDEIERNARELAGGVHARGAIPARFWKESIRQHLLPTLPKSEAERVNRVMRDVLSSHLTRLEGEAREKGWR